MGNASPAPIPPAQLFISYSRADHDFVTDFNRQLRLRIPTFLDADGIQAGALWPDVLEKALRETKGVAVFVGPSGLGPWQKREVFFAIDRQVAEESAGKAFPVIPLILPGVQNANITRGFLSLYNRIYLGQTTQDDAIEAIARALEATEPLKGEEGGPKVCPYLGLSRFTEFDAPLYFGRDPYAIQLFDKVQQHALTALVGPSGSGKSSLVFAGLVPKLRKDRRSTWEVLSFTPRQHPWRSLADALMQFVEPNLSFGSFQEESEKLARVLERDLAGFESSVDRLLRLSNGSNRLLVVVDQFEELLTLTARSDCLNFVNFLLQACKLPALRIVLTLRADYYGRAIDLDRDFTSLLVQNQIALAPMRPEEVLEAVERPAKVVGLPIEPALLDQIRNEVAGQPNSLPLLEYALVEIWKRNNAKLTYDNYVDAGRIAGAIAASADKLYDSLPPVEQEAAHRLFLRLVRITDIGQEGAATRAPVRRSDLDETSWTVALKFADPLVRLLVASGPTDPHDHQEGFQTVEVAHEALIRNWKRLQDWIKADSEFLLWRQRLALRMSEWERTGRSEAGLLSGVFLEEAEAWLKDRGRDLSQSEIEYITLPTGDAYQINKAVSEANPVTHFADRNAPAVWKTLLYLYRSDWHAAPDSDFPDQTFLYLANVMIKLGEPLRAVEFANHIGSAEERASVLANIADSFAQAGDRERLLGVVAKARDAVAQIKGLYGNYSARTPVLSLLFCALAKTGERELARNVANQFEEPNANFLERAANAFASAERWQDALELLRPIADQPRRAAGIMALLDSLNPAADKAAMEAIARECIAALPQDWSYRSKFDSLLNKLVHAQAIDLAITLAREQNELDGNRSAALAAISRALCDSDKHLASTYAAEAWSSALRVENDVTRIEALRRAVQVWAEAGAIHSALDAARVLSKYPDSAYALVEVALFYKQSNQKEQAAAVLAEATTYAHQMEGYARTTALTQIVALYLDLDLLPEASAAARQSGSPGDRGQIFVDVLKGRLKEFQLDHLDAIKEEILQAIAEDDKSYPRDSNLMVLLKLLIDTGEDPSRVFPVFQAIADPARRKSLFSSTASHLRKLGLPDKVLELIHSIPDLTERDSILSNYITSAPAGQLENYQLVLEIHEDKTRDEVIEKIVPVLIQAGKPNLAYELVQGTQNPRLRDDAFYILAVDLRAAGHSKTAVSWADEVVARGATYQAREKAVRLLAQWRDTPEAESALDRMWSDVHDVPDAAFALALFGYALTKPLDKVRNLRLLQKLTPEPRKRWFQRRASKPPERRVPSLLKIASAIQDSQIRFRVFAALFIAYARAGKMDDALEIAEHISDVQIRTTAFLDAASVSERAVARQITERGIALARAIKDEYQRRQSLTLLLPLLTRQGKLPEAFEVARDVASSESELIHHLIEQIPLAAQSVGPPGIEAIKMKVIQLIRKLPNERQYEVRFLSTTLASAGFPHEAIDTAFEIAQPAAHVSLLTEIVAMLAQKKMPNGRWQAAQIALKDIQSLDQYSQRTARVALVKAFRAGGLAAEAIAIARQLAPGPGTREYVDIVAPVLVATGFLEQAVEVVDAMPDPSARAQFITGLIPVSGEAADRELASQLARKAVPVSTQIPNETFRRPALSALGNKIAEARADSAMADVNQLSEPMDRISLWKGYLEGVLLRGNRAMALKSATAILNDCANVTKVTDSWDRNRALDQVTEMMRKARLYDDLKDLFDREAQRMPEVLSAQNQTMAPADRIRTLLEEGSLADALNIARSEPDFPTKVKLLTLTANFLAQRQETEQAETLASEAEQLISEIADYEQKSRSSARVAEAWANLHHYQRSRELARDCHRPTEKLLAYCAILRNYLPTAKPELAMPLTAVPQPEI